MGESGLKLNRSGLNMSGVGSSEVKMSGLKRVKIDGSGLQMSVVEVGKSGWE